jgi:hypothetical protein
MSGDAITKLIQSPEFAKMLAQVTGKETAPRALLKEERTWLIRSAW